MRHRGWIVAGVLVGLVALTAPAHAGAPTSLTWTAGPVGGGWYIIAGGIAELVRDTTGVNIKVVPGGGTQNQPLIAGVTSNSMGTYPGVSTRTRYEAAEKIPVARLSRSLHGVWSLVTRVPLRS